MGTRERRRKKGVVEVVGEGELYDYCKNYEDE